MSDLTRQDQVRMRNLRRANEVRARRKELKEKVRAGEVDAIALVAGRLELWEPVIEPWKIDMLLRMVPGIGPSTAQEIYEVGRFVPTLRVGALSPERRARLAELCAQGARIPANHGTNGH